MNDLIEYVGKGALIGVGLAVVAATATEIIIEGGSIAVGSYSDVISLSEEYLGSWGRSVAVLAPFFALIGAYFGVEAWVSQDSDQNHETGDNQ